MHAVKAEQLPFVSWNDERGNAEFLIDDVEVRSFYGPSIGKIAKSHWMDAWKLEGEFPHDLGALGGRTNNKVRLRLIACILRLADAMHIDGRRAPEFLRKLLTPKGLSLDHWVFQAKLAVPYVQDDALVYSSSAPFKVEDAEAWWIAFDAIEMIDSELKASDALLREGYAITLNASRVAGAGAPSHLAKYIPCEGWEPINSRVRISDVPKIVTTLGGQKLYGNSPKVALRELLQNCCDAIKARRVLQNRESDWGQISVQILEEDGQYNLIVEDNGTGMSRAVLTGPLIDFGNSFWSSGFASEEFPGLHSNGFKATGGFGIGFFSVFMIADKVRVVSRRFDQASENALALEFSDGMASRPVLCKVGTGGPLDGGTRVEMTLKIPLQQLFPILTSYDKDGYHEHEELEPRVIAVLENLAPASPVSINLVAHGQKKIVINARDWESLSDDRLLERLGRKRHYGSILLPLQRIEEEGVLLGRAAITNFGSESGVVVTGGLRAGKAAFFEGIIEGREPNAARDKASFAVSAPLIQNWARKQVELAEKAEISDRDKLYISNVAHSLDVSVGMLPIAVISGNYLSYDDVKKF